jgi:DNA-directed RNA polymerase sigma subunit (sigma70/sigma32)
MSEERELELVRAMKAGSREAEDTLTRQYAGIGIAMALSFKKTRRYEGSDLDDLISAGLLGVVEGIRHYEEGRNSRVSTCVYFWVRAQLRRCKNKQRFITFPLSKEEFISKMQLETRLFFNATGRAPTPEELAELLGTTEENMCQILSESAQTTTYSVDSGNVRDREESSYGWTDDFVIIGQSDNIDVLAGSEELELVEASINDDLDSREAEVIRGRFLQGRTLQDLGEGMNLSRERVRQIESGGLRKLRKALKEKLDL